MALNKAKRELSIVSGNVSATGTVSEGFMLTDGASATGSCTLSDTSLYTFTWPVAFREKPVVTVSSNTTGARIATITPSTTGCAVRFLSYDGTTKTAAAFGIMAIGRGKTV